MSLLLATTHCLWLLTEGLGAYEALPALQWNADGMFTPCEHPPLL